MTHRASTRAVRQGLRAAVPAFAVGTVLAAAPAFADRPANWTSPGHTSGLDFLVVLFLIPAGLFLLISALVWLPSALRGSGADDAPAWEGESLWFGGPRQGVSAAEHLDPKALESAGNDRGGASARW